MLKKLKQKFSIKYILLIILLIIGIIIYFGFYLKKNKINLTNVSYDKASDFYFLNKNEVSKLLATGELKKNDFYYHINRIEKPDKQLTFYGVRIEPINHVEVDASYYEGIFVKNENNNNILQSYLGHIWFWSNDEINRYVTYEDINKDGLNEFIISGTGYVMSISSIKNDVFQIVDGKFVQLTSDINKLNQHIVTNILDIKIDGIYELIVADNSWELTTCTDHSRAPIKYLIYSWQNGKYQDSSIDYPMFYEKLVNMDISEDCSGDVDLCFGPALTKYFAYKQAGKEVEGWNKFLKLTENKPNSKSCRDYVIKLHNSNSDLTPPE